jgi:hypothetical protein
VPSASDHYRFAAAVLASLARAPEASAETAWLAAHAGLVFIGTQGPDPFYFYGEVPWRRRTDKKRLDAFTEFLHGSDPTAVFPVLAQTAAAAEGDNREAAFAYLYGLLLHYLLDRAVHPYVFFSTGFDAAGALSGRFAAHHARFETMMAEAARGDARPAVTSPRRMFAAARDDLAEADLLLSLSFPERVEPGRFSESWADMTMVLALLWDPSGLKRRLAEALGGGESRAFAMISPRKPASGDAIDYANAGKAVWQHPVSGIESTASVAELTAAAASEADAALRAVDGARRGEPADWNRLLRGVNHDGIRPGDRLRTYRSVYG